MSEPKFAVGEIVVLQSKNCPQHNGEYTVEAIYRDGEFLPNGKRLSSGSGIGYYLGFVSDNGKPTWKESALRKRHQPGEYSFDGLKQILSMPIDRRDFA